MKQGYIIKESILMDFQKSFIIVDNYTITNEVAFYPWFTEDYTSILTSSTVAIFKIKYK